MLMLWTYESYFFYSPYKYFYHEEMFESWLNQYIKIIKLKASNQKQAQPSSATLKNGWIITIK